ncbi:MAG: hypothetical protein ACSHYF_13855 [Verrucomicrobiaceae bacterium]
MKKITLWLVAALAPILLTTPVSAEAPASPAAEETVETKTPVLTYYYFDG